MKVRKKFRKLVCMLLCALMFVETAINPIAVKAATSQTEKMQGDNLTESTELVKATNHSAGQWKNYNYKDGKITRTYKYFYPDRAKSYGIPESYFYTPGNHNVYSKLAGNSYATVAVEDKNDHPNGNKYTTVVHTAFVVYQISHKQTGVSAGPGSFGAGEVSFKVIDYNGDSKVRITPLNVGVVKTPVVQIGLGREKKTNSSSTYNPDLFKSITLSYKANNGRTTSGIASLTGNVIGDSKVTPSEIIKKPAAFSLTKITSGQQFKNNYSDKGKKLRSASAYLKNACFENGDYVTLKYKTNYPAEVQNIKYNKTRSLQTNFNFVVTMDLGKKKTILPFTSKVAYTYTVKNATLSNTRVNIGSKKIKASVSLVKYKKYTRTELEKKYKLTYNDRMKLTKGLDYTLKMKINYTTNKATMVATGINAFKGTKVISSQDFNFKKVNNKEYFYLGKQPQKEKNTCYEHQWKVIKKEKGKDCKTAGVNTCKCKKCGKQEKRKGAYGSHSYNSPTITKKANNCKETGIKTYTCKICKKKKTESYKGSHNYKWVEVDLLYRKNECTTCKHIKEEKKITSAQVRTALNNMGYKGDALALVLDTVKDTMGVNAAIGLMANVQAEGNYDVVEYSFSKSGRGGFKLPSGGTQMKTIADIKYCRDWRIDNAKNESGNYLGSCGVGCVQWSFGRRRTFLDICLDIMKKDSDVTTANWEIATVRMLTTELAVGTDYNTKVTNAANNAGGAPEAWAEAFCDYYEMPGGWCGASNRMTGAGSACQTRKRYATEIKNAILNIK